MASVFSKIIAGEIPGNFAWQDEHCVVFSTIEPRSAGHMLVVPRVEVDNFLDAQPALVSHLFEVAQVVGQAARDAFGVGRVLVVVAGFDVPHLHVHVIPTDTMKVLRPEMKVGAEPEILRANTEKIRESLRKLGHGQNVPTAVDRLD